MSAVKLAVLALIASGASGCLRSDRFAYSWDDRQVLCSDSIDDMNQDAPWALVQDALDAAGDDRRVALFHAHAPGSTVTVDAIRQILDMADANHLGYYTYADLQPGPRRPGIALAFDDNAVDAWMTIRDLLAEHHARVTFFVSRYSLLTDDEHAAIAQLAADGHDIEPHSVHHLHPLAYVQAHGLQAYMTDEALPSLQVLADLGYTPTAYAYPFGGHSEELDQAMLANVAHVRVSPGACPYD